MTVDLATGWLPCVDGRGRPRTVLVAKATLRLRPDAVAELVAPQPLIGARFALPAASQDVLADDVLFKPLADVVVRASFEPPTGFAGGPWLAGISIARGADVLLRKSRVVERGPDAVPRLIDPASSDAGRDGFDAVVTSRPIDPGAVLDEAGADLSSAPPDQRIAHLRGGEQIWLAGLSPAAWNVRVRLPAVIALASVDGGARGLFPLACDTLCIDADRMMATMTYRAAVDLDGSAGMDVRAFLAPGRAVEEVAGEPPSWSPRSRPVPRLDPGGARSTSTPAHGPESRSPSERDVRLVDDAGWVVGTFPSPMGEGSSQVVVVKGTFALVPGERARVADAQRPLSHDVFAEDGSLLVASELAPFKPRADVLLTGTVRALPDRQAAVATLEIGSVRRRIAAFGPRTWTAAGLPSAPGAFVPVALAYANAVGGEGTVNPVGSSTALSSAPPLLEDPADLVRRRGDAPAPACTGPVSPEWSSRAGRLGTFDAAWRHTTWPRLPADVDPSFFQCAPPSQQCGFMRGDETYRLDAMGPDGGALEGSLPGLAPRAFVGAQADREVSLRLDTVSFDADARAVTLVWRGAFDLAGALPLPLVVLVDDLRAPRDEARVRARAFALVKEGPFGLAPRRAEGEPRREEPAAAPIAVLTAATARKVVTAAIGVGVGVAALPAGPRPEGRATFTALLDRGASLRGWDFTGIDLSGADLSGRDLGGAKLGGANLTDAKLERASLVGANLAGIVAPRASFRGADLSLADLADADLRAADFTKATLFRADLSGARLIAARLERAIALEAQLVGADLTRAVASFADLTKADLSRANLREATLLDAHLDDAKLYEAAGPKAVFDRSTLVDARWECASFDGASFREVDAPGAVWERASLRGAVFVGAKLRGAVFSGAILVAADLGGADAREALFRSANLETARLRGANLMKAIFQGAVLRRASLRRANLYQCETLDADVDGADLTGAFVAGTKLAARG